MYLSASEMGFVKKVKKKFISIFKNKVGSFRRLYYRLLSDIVPMGKPECVQPTLFLGRGTIKFGTMVGIGLRNSKQYYSAYTYFEARKPNSEIVIGSNVFFNNSCTFICESSSIKIGDDCLIGPCCEFLDSDFHPLSPKKRRSGTHKAKSITLENNVFLGANVIILKGVTIGENSVVGANSVVVSDVPKNTLVAGNPAKVIKYLA